MRVLVVGEGGREHALVWKIAQSPKVSSIYCAPGNAGITQQAECVDIRADDISGLVRFAKNKQVDLTVVGPELPLTCGIVDVFAREGMAAFGPSCQAAALEGSKVFAKKFMHKYGIPTAPAHIFDSSLEAKEYIKKTEAPWVVKADGLAGGKGVVVAASEEEALGAVDKIMEEKIFGKSGKQILIEEFIEGQELSILAFTDGECVVPMVSSQDYKRVFDGDQGPNTGGMGAYSPVSAYTAGVAEKVFYQILQPAVRGMALEGHPYRGVIYAGLMVNKSDVKVLEFNCRFGDPEAQPILRRLQSDLVEIMQAVLAGKLRHQQIKWIPEASVCVVMASQGYPQKYDKGKIIYGLNTVPENVIVFQAATRFQDKHLLTAGGRVLGVTALGEDVFRASQKAYKALEGIYFENMHYRLDIGKCRS